jgi:hypothetical protein
MNTTTKRAGVLTLVARLWAGAKARLPEAVLVYVDTVRSVGRDLARSARHEDRADDRWEQAIH